MTKKITTITIIIISILLVSLYVISSTYSLIIDVIDNEGTTEIINEITIKDLVTDESGSYNTLYYDILRELDINDKEANILMESIPLNKTLNTILDNVVNYRFHNKNKLTNDELYNLIVSSVNSDDNIDVSIKNKVIIKSSEYLNDISNYLYDIKTNMVEQLA